MRLLNRNHRATESVEAEHTEHEELSERVRRVIGAYGVSTTLDARQNLYRTTAGASPSSKNVEIATASDV
jgi:hypothetical protein